MIDRPHVSDPAISRFATLAEEFCELVRQSTTGSGVELLIKVHRLLPQLYAAGLALPSTSILFDDDVDTEEEPDLPSSAERRTLFDALARSFGERGYYREVFDPYAPPEEAELTGSLADDIADIYADLLRGLRRWKRGESGAALWEWRFGLESHWGEHATGALRALYARSAWHDLDWPREDGSDPNLYPRGDAERN